jgi:hypothetical protein
MPEEVVNTKKRPLTELEIINKINKLIPGLTKKGLQYVSDMVDDAKRQEDLGI